MNPTFILAQILATISWGMFLYSYHREDINKILRIQICAGIFGIISYILLGADAGIIVSVTELIAAFLYYKFDKDLLVFFCTLPVYTIFGYFAAKEYGITDALPMIAAIIDGLSLVFNKKTAVIGNAIATTLWIFYDASALAYTAAISDIITVISDLSIVILGYSHMLHVGRLRIEACRYFSHKIELSIARLDRKNYDKKYLWDEGVQKTTFEHDRNSILVIYDRQKTIGYINLFAISEKEYNRLIRARNYYLVLDPNEIIGFRKRHKNFLLIESVNIDASYDSRGIQELIARRLRIYFHNRQKRGYYLHGALLVPITSFEHDFAKRLDFTKLKEYAGGEELHQLDRGQIEKFIA